MSGKKKEYGYIRPFFLYWSKVIWRAVTTIVFLVVDVLGVMLLIFNLDQPKVPLVLSLGIFATTIVVSAFLVWRDERLSVIELERDLAEIKNTAPNYKVDLEVVSNFELKDLVNSAAAELKEVKKTLAHKSRRSVTNSLLAEAIRQQSSLSFGMTESISDKEKRLQNHLECLVAYSERAKHTYKVNIVFEASRSDENIEFKIEASKDCKIYVENNYITNNIPETKAKTMFDHSYILPTGRLKLANANSSYPYSYGDGDKAFSKMNKINARKKYSMFDEDIYIETDLKDLELSITIHSRNIVDPQTIKKKITFDQIYTHKISSV